MNSIDRIIPCVTYVLELDDGPKNPPKYYVGKTWDFNRRLGEHMMGICGSKWTRLYKPKRIVSVHKGDIERVKTFEMMLQKGYQHVRGSDWCKIELKTPPTALYEYESAQKAKGIVYTDNKRSRSSPSATVGANIKRSKLSSN